MATKSEEEAKPRSGADGEAEGGVGEGCKSELRKLHPALELRFQLFAGRGEAGGVRGGSLRVAGVGGAVGQGALDAGDLLLQRLDRRRKRLELALLVEAEAPRPARRLGS